MDNEENGFTLYQEMGKDEIEIVDDSIFTHMMQSLILCNGMESEYIKDVFYAVYPPGNVTNLM